MKQQRIIIYFSGGLFAAWLVRALPGFLNQPHGLLRFLLGGVFALAVLFRHKPLSDGKPPPPVLRNGLLALAGALLSIFGRVFAVSQFEWLGLILLLSAALCFALPVAWHKDVFLAAFLLYWVHPLPGQVFAALETTLQQASVTGSEALLHVMNERVWADGFTLHTGMAVFEIPEWCSGMRAATTVFLLTCGLAMLFRLPFLWGLLLTVAAVVQSLLLNIIRISAVVILAPGFTERSAQDALHDTSGILLVSAVLLAGWESRLLARAVHERRRRISEINEHRMRRVTEHPPFWRNLLYHWKILTALLVLAAATAGLVWRLRESHRVAMWEGVVQGFVEANRLDLAKRLGMLVMASRPGDDDWSMQYARILIQRGDYEQALEILAAIDSARQDTNEVLILRGYALMWMGELEQAVEVIAGIPEELRERDPRVAMILAEMGVFFDRPDEVERYVPVAAGFQPNLNRVRALYPYMRRHRQWDAMTRSASPHPYREAAPALAVIEAHMNYNNTAVVAEMTLNLLERWPDDPRLIEPLYFMALKRINTEWEQLFANHLKLLASSLDDIDALYGLLPRCFSIGRADLAWHLMMRIRELDGDHPYLPMAVSRFGAEWFKIRTAVLGLPASENFAMTDISPFMRLAGKFPLWQPMVGVIPYGAEITGTRDLVELRRKVNDEAIRRFAQRHAHRRLSIEAVYEYVHALERAGRRDEAIQVLDILEQEHSGEALRSRLTRSELYERAADWQNVYETLRSYPELPAEVRTVAAMTRLVRAQLELNLMIAAWSTVRQMQQDFPLSSRVPRLSGMLLLRMNRPQEALRALRHGAVHRGQAWSVLMIETLYQNQRYQEMEELSRTLLLPVIPVEARAKQRMHAAPAELTALWPHYGVPSGAEFAANAVALRRNLRVATSPFLAGMLEQWILCYEDILQPGDDRTIWQADVWLNIARDNTEAAVLLNQLTIMLSYAGRYAEARETALLAAEALPEVPLLWEILIGLSGNEAAAAARRGRGACPDAPEIWLADLVLRSRAWVEAGKDTAQLDALLAEEMRAIGGSMPPESVTRAADFLLRGGLKHAALVAAEAAAVGAPSYLPAQIIALRGAMLLEDREKTLRYTRAAIRAAHEPDKTLYESLARLRIDSDEIPLDGDMLEAVKQLVQSDPENTLWLRLLGYMRLQRGGWEIVDAAGIMLEAIERGMDDPLPFLVGAEASRRAGNNQRAVDLLRRGLEKHPENAEMLNNLVFSLAQDEAGLAEARGKVDQLLNRMGDNPHALDTAAFVYMAGGEYAAAQEMIGRVQKTAASDSPLAFRSRVMQARIQLELEHPEEARAILIEAGKFVRHAAQDDLLEAGRLRNRADSEIQQRQREALRP